CRQDCTVIQMARSALLPPTRSRGYRADINLAGETDEVFSLLELSPGLHRDPDGPIRSSPAYPVARLSRGHQPGGR
ncbi:hypothetical protein CQA86_32500, partial [Klebsiella pneumoniae]